MVLTILIGLASGAASAWLYSAGAGSGFAVGLVFLGCAVFWGWIASLLRRLCVWLFSEMWLMGRRPRIDWRLSPFKLSLLSARLLGLVLPFAAINADEGWAVLLNPARWALVPVTVVLCLVIITLPLWAAIKFGSRTLRNAPS